MEGSAPIDHNQAGSARGTYKPVKLGMTITGLCLLAVWAAWWAGSLHANYLLFGNRTWIPTFDYLGIDFLGNYYPARHWAGGGNPYVEPFGDPLGRTHAYPPLMFWCFLWCVYLEPLPATWLWTAVLGLIACGCAWASWKHRSALVLEPVAFPMVLAATLCSTAVLFAMERGNCDLLLLVPVGVAAWAFGQHSRRHDVVAGICLAVACWMKIYPGLLVLGLLSLRRWRSMTTWAVTCMVIGLVTFQDLPSYFKNAQSVIDRDSPAVASLVFHFAHTLTGSWNGIWADTPLAESLGAIPARAATFLILGPMLTVVGWAVWRSRNTDKLVYPLCLWLMSLATFIPPVSNDYNLAGLPLAALAVWDRRDPVWIHILMAFALLWWQPVALPIGPGLLLFFKLAGLAGVAGSMVHRLREQQLSMVQQLAHEPIKLISQAA